MFIRNIFLGNKSTLILYWSGIRLIRKWHNMDHFCAEHKEWLQCAPGAHRAPINWGQPGGKTLYQCTLCNAHQPSVHSNLSWHQFFWPLCPSFWTVTVPDYSNCLETTHYNFWGFFFSSQGCTNLNWSHCSPKPVTNFSLHLPH